MSDPYRGYAGAERPLAFDERPARRRGGPAPVTLIVSLLFLAIAVGGVFFLYRGGARGGGDAPEPVGAPVRDVRSPAPAQSQESDPAAGLSIYRADPGAPPPAPAFVSPPEQPAESGAASPPTARAKVSDTAPPMSVQAVQAVQNRPPPVKEAAAAGLPPAKAPAKDTRPASIDRLIADAEAPPPTPKAVPPQVQIGAFSSQDLADQGWDQAAGVASGTMTGKGKKVIPVTKADGSTLYRTAITGFASREEAQALCDRLKSAGKTCFVR